MINLSIFVYTIKMAKRKIAAHSAMKTVFGVFFIIIFKRGISYFLHISLKKILSFKNFNDKSSFSLKFQDNSRKYGHFMKIQGFS